MNDVGAMGHERQRKSLADVRTPTRRRGLQDRDRLAVERAAPDQPVRGVLERAGDAERVLGDGEERPCGLLAGIPKTEDRPSGSVSRSGSKSGSLRTSSAIATRMPSGDAARAAARRTALLIDSRLRLPETARISAVGRGEAGWPLFATQSSSILFPADETASIRDRPNEAGTTNWGRFGVLWMAMTLGRRTQRDLTGA